MINKEDKMNQDTTFVYKYSAKENKEINEIRNKYLPKTESKLEELRRLDLTVQNAGMVLSLSAGICGMLIFGLGMCLAMQVIGSGVVAIALGVILGIVGSAIMISAYPIYKTLYKKTKEKLTPRILELANELSGKKDQI